MNRITVTILWVFTWSLISLNAQNLVVNGADRTEEYLPLLKGKRVGLVINHTSLVGDRSEERRVGKEW